MKTTYFAAKDITIEGKVVKKKGEAALVVETDLPVERALRGIENGALTTEKPAAAAAAASGAEPKPPAAK